MNSTLYDITADMMTEVQRQELIAANLAGINQPGFKGRYLVEPSFADTLQSAQETAEKTAATDFRQGELRSTGRALDLALVGPGFFEVATGAGEERLTRNGHFVINADGVLTTPEGYEVAGRNGRIQFSPDDSLQQVEVTEDGTVHTWDSARQRREVGRLRVVQVQDPDRLERMSSNYFTRPPELDLSAAEDSRVLNEHLEGPNIAAVQEMASMIESLRRFEMGQKMLEMNSQLAQQEQQTLQA